MLRDRASGRRAATEATCAQMNKRKKGGIQEFINVLEHTKEPPRFSSAKAARSLCCLCHLWFYSLMRVEITGLEENTHTQTHTPLYICIYEYIWPFMKCHQPSSLCQTFHERAMERSEEGLYSIQMLEIYTIITPFKIEEQRKGGTIGLNSILLTDQCFFPSKIELGSQDGLMF